MTTETAAPLSLRAAALRLLAFALVIFALDRASKIWVVEILQLPVGAHQPVFPPFFNLHMAYNTGINFGLLSSDDPMARWVLIGIAVAVSAALTVWALRRRNWVFVAGTGILVGGALGNALDRVIYPGVADFINMSCCGFTNPYAFNIADIAIFLGAIVIAVRG